MSVILILLMTGGLIAYALSVWHARTIRRRGGLARDEFAKYLSGRQVSADVGIAVFDYYSDLVGGRIHLAPSTSRAELAGAEVEDCLDDARLILQQLSVNATFDELSSLSVSQGVALRSLEDVAQFVQVGDAPTNRLTARGTSMATE